MPSDRIWECWFGTDQIRGALEVARDKFAPGREHGPDLNLIEAGVTLEMMLKEAGKRTKEWQTAGKMLRIILSMQLYHPDLRSSSIRRAQHILANLPKDPTSDLAYHGEKSIKKAWRKYRQVSHIAAAVLEVGPGKQTNILEGLVRFPVQILAVARGYQEFGMSYHQKHGSKAALFRPGDLIEIPKEYVQLCDAAADPGPLPSHMLELAESYRAPIPR